MAKEPSCGSCGGSVRIIAGDSDEGVLVCEKDGCTERGKRKLFGGVPWQPPRAGGSRPLRMTADRKQPRDTSERRDAGKRMVAALGETLGVPLEAASLVLDGGCKLRIDGASADRRVLCEVFPHLGMLKPGQQRKILGDAFKLAFVARRAKKKPDLHLAFADDVAAKPFTGGAWAAQALAAFGIEVHVVKVSGSGSRAPRRPDDRASRKTVG